MNINSITCIIYVYFNNINNNFPQVKAFIEDSFARNGKVLVHGNAGMSRR